MELGPVIRLLEVPTSSEQVRALIGNGGRYAAWSVVDLDDNEDVADWSVVASPDGRVHVVYDAQRSVLALQSLARYACIEGRWVRVRGE